MYFAEKSNFDGVLISSILYGMPKTQPLTRCPFVRDHFIRLVRSRDRDRTILSMYDRPI